MWILVTAAARGSRVSRSAGDGGSGRSSPVLDDIEVLVSEGGGGGDGDGELSWQWLEMFGQ